MVNKFTAFSAGAVVPDQLTPYVAAVSGLETKQIGACLLHYGGSQGVLVAYGLHDPLRHIDIEEALAECAKLKLEKITTLGPEPPACAPAGAQIARDTYWQITIPAEKPKGKLANILRRADQEIEISQGGWTGEHSQIIADFCERKKNALDQGSIFLFQQLEKYLGAAKGAKLFNARLKTGELAAFAIADFTALATVFYMFAFRKASAHPGSADRLLFEISKEAEANGHSRVNLGLGINPGVEFFKKKWGACEFAPYVETSWTLKQPEKKSWLRKLFGAK